MGCDRDKRGGFNYFPGKKYSPFWCVGDNKYFSVGERVVRPFFFPPRYDFVDFIFQGKGFWHDIFFLYRGGAYNTLRAFFITQGFFQPAGRVFFFPPTVVAGGE